MPQPRVQPSPRSTIPPERRAELLDTLRAQVGRFRRVLDDLAPAHPIASSQADRDRCAAARAAEGLARLRAAHDEAERSGAPVRVPRAPSVLEALRREDPELHRRLRTLYVRFDETVAYVAGGVAGSGVTRGERVAAVADALKAQMARTDARAVGTGVVRSAAKAVGTKGASALFEVVVGLVTVSRSAAALLGKEGAASALAAGRDAGGVALGQAAGALAQSLAVLEHLTPAQAAAQGIAALGGQALEVDVAAPGGHLAAAWAAGYVLEPTVRGLFTVRLAELDERLDAWARGVPTLSEQAGARVASRNTSPDVPPGEVAAAAADAAAFASTEHHDSRVIDVRVRGAILADAGRWPEFRNLVGPLVHDSDVEHILWYAAHDALRPERDALAAVAFLTEHVSPRVREFAADRLGLAYRTVNGVVPAAAPAPR